MEFIIQGEVFTGQKGNFCFIYIVIGKQSVAGQSNVEQFTINGISHIVPSVMFEIIARIKIAQFGIPMKEIIRLLDKHIFMDGSIIVTKGEVVEIVKTPAIG